MRHKKFRGNKRYYRRLQRKAENYHIELGGPDDWYDLWHDHFDWQGRGNESGRARTEHLRALFTAFERVLNQTKTYQQPYQLFLSLNTSDSYQDTLYFHTPNPNENNFPHKFDDFTWGVPVPRFLRPHMKDEYEVGKSEENKTTWYVIKAKGTYQSTPEDAVKP